MNWSTKGVHGVGPPRRLGASRRTRSDVPPRRRMALSGLPGRSKHAVGQAVFTGRSCFGTGGRTPLWIMGMGGPVALARNAPVAQAYWSRSPGRFRPAWATPPWQPRCRPASAPEKLSQLIMTPLCLSAPKVAPGAVSEGPIDQHHLLDVGGPYFRRKFEIALVIRRAAEDGASRRNPSARSCDRPATGSDGQADVRP